MLEVWRQAKYPNCPLGMNRLRGFAISAAAVASLCDDDGKTLKRVFDPISGKIHQRLIDKDLIFLAELEKLSLELWKAGVAGW